MARAAESRTRECRWHRLVCARNRASSVWFASRRGRTRGPVSIQTLTVDSGDCSCTPLWFVVGPPPPQPDKHRVLGNPLKDDGTWTAKGYGTAYFAGGCFWGLEKTFWTTPGVVSTAVGYQGGEVENPTYRGVCTGGTGHTEVVKVVFDSAATSYTNLLNVFWSSHNPTTANRQGNDVGTQYRSAIFYTTPEQKADAERTMAHFNACAKGKLNGATTEIKDAETEPFYFAEAYHQQYLDANPGGYCPSHGTGLYTPVE